MIYLNYKVCFFWLANNFHTHVLSLILLIWISFCLQTNTTYIMYIIIVIIIIIIIIRSYIVNIVWCQHDPKWSQSRTVDKFEAFEERCGWGSPVELTAQLHISTLSTAMCKTTAFDVETRNTYKRMSWIEASGGLVYWEAVLPTLLWKIDVKTRMMMEMISAFFV